jgi:hypothetical protein
VYRLFLDPVAEQQITSLPTEALSPLAELFALLETAPWSGLPFNPANPRANMLTHTFGERGLATYLVLEQQHEVYVIRIEMAIKTTTPPARHRSVDNGPDPSRLNTQGSPDSTPSSSRRAPQ